jgi:hypothetical protein
MLVRIFGSLLVFAILPARSFGQVIPLLSGVPTVTDTQISGTAQGLTPQYDAISLYLCTSASATQPLDCSAEDTIHGRKRTLVNLGSAPFAVNTPDGKFTITIASPLAPGTYVWIAQQTRSHTDQREISKTSTPVRVPVPLLRKASISVSGFDSASKDVGAKVSLYFDHGLQNEGLGETQFLISGTYDDKWKHTAFSSNVTQNYSASLFQLRQLRPSTAWGPYATAYHNNTQGIRVEQIYGAGITQAVKLGSSDYLSLSFGMQAMLENLYTPGISTNLGGLHLGAELNHEFGNRTSVDVKVGATPVFTQNRAWSAAGDFDFYIPLSRRWSLQFEVVDNYYEIAPKTFNKNYMAPSIGISFK